MHYSLEIILPAMPIEHVEKAVAELMAPFDENNDSPNASSRPFWDWYQIGGRFTDGREIRPLSDVSPDREVFSVMIVAPLKDGRLVPGFMTVKELWNGVSFQPSAWDGKVSSALLVASVKGIETDPSWLAVTVDYHA